MTKANKVLFITQEITPYVSESEMANIGRNLPQAIQEKGREIRTFMPKWGNINERRNQLHEVIRLSGMNLIIDDTDHPLIIKVASIQSARMQVYFIDNDDYFQNRLQTADENGVEYDDNDSRAIFYARGVLETVKKLRWCPDVIHCHGWMTALAPLYIKKAYKDEPSFRDAKVVFSVYEDDFKGTFNNDFASKLMLKGINKKDVATLKDPVDYATLCKLAVDYSDGIVQNSEHVNEDVPRVMLIPMVILAFLAFFIGMFPQYFISIVMWPVSMLVNVDKYAANPALDEVFKNTFGLILSDFSWFFLIFFAVVAVMFIVKLIVNRKARISNTWGCGYNRLNNHVQYTGSSYANLFISTCLLYTSPSPRD